MEIMPDDVPKNYRFSDQDKYILNQMVEHVQEIFNTRSKVEAIAYFSPCMNTELRNEKSNSFPEIVVDRIADENSQSLQLVSQFENQSQSHRILNKLINNANQNVLRPKQGYRFDDDTIKFALYVRTLSDPLLYDILHRNLELALPSLSSVNKRMHSSNNITEGLLRCHELLFYLKERNLPLEVAISEDATRIDGKIEFDPRTNQLIGFVLPTHLRTGLPISHVYKAKDTETIVSHFMGNRDPSSFLNTVMAQPIANTPPFCLLAFGSDGRYSAQDVSNRWKFITSELKKLGITVLTISSDSDPRYNCAMRKNSSLGLQTDKKQLSCKLSCFNDVEWFSCGGDLSFPFYFQDNEHIGTKIRNFFLKTLKDEKLLPFGPKFYIQHKHLQHLLDNFGKDEHQLTKTTLNPIDRMNFSSVLRICDPYVIHMLRRHVKGSEATAKFLEVMRNFLDAFIITNMPPLERISNVWYAIFLMRLWREYVLNNKELSLKKNFLTFYCYTCLEQNAHSLVLILIYLKRENKSHLFQPFLFNSQACEAFYRQVRSLGSTFSTVVNCSVKDILARINKIELQNNLAEDKLTDFRLPTNKKSSSLTGVEHFLLPNETEIIEEIERSKLDAIKVAVEFGILPKKSKRTKIECEIEPYVQKKINNNQKLSDNRVNLQTDVKETLEKLKFIRLKNYAEKFLNKPVEETSSYTEIFGAEKRIIVKKSSLSWLLRTNSPKLSSDRSERVKATSNIYKKKNNYKRKKRVNHFSTVILKKFCKPIKNIKYK